MLFAFKTLFLFSNIKKLKKLLTNHYFHSLPLILFEKYKMETEIKSDSIDQDFDEEFIIYPKKYNKNKKSNNENMDNIDIQNETKIKLKLLLDSSTSTKKHIINIMKLKTLKEAHIYCKYNNLSGQFTGPILEKFIKNKYNMIKNNASSCNGDLKCNEINVEIKASNGGKDNNKFNFVQLRMNHDCEYIFTAYYIDYCNLDDLGELFIFRLNKENIKNLILKYGGYAHGTIGELGVISLDDLNDVNNQKEYALRPKYGDKCWNELLNFRVDEIII
jgi:hypothetical protein